MSSEQVAGILRQCPKQVRLVVARSVREPTAPPSSSSSTTTIIAADKITNTSPLMPLHPSLISETSLKVANNNALSSATPSVSMIIDNDEIRSSSQNKIFLRTERLLESNHNFEKIIENLREQVRIDFLLILLSSKKEKEND